MRNIKAALYGIIAASGALSLELIASNLILIIFGKDIQDGYAEHVTPFLIAVVLIEETFKFIMLKRFYSDEPAGRRRISSAFYAGLGFALVEILLAVLSTFFNKTTPYFDMGLAGILVLHITTTLLIGSFLLHAKSPSAAFPLKIILLAGLIHLGYNLMVIYDWQYAVIFSFLIITLLGIMHSDRKLMPKNA